MTGFMECDACLAKPGSPTLCSGCAHNRRVIGAAERLREALRRIRFAGNNEHPTAVWMQKVAAHAMEPDKWPAPERMEQSAAVPVCIHGLVIASESSHDSFCRDCQRITRDTTVRLVRRAAAASCVASGCSCLRSEPPGSSGQAPAPDTRVMLADCPPGLFRWGRVLGFKSEYMSAIHQGRPVVDAYVVASGEFFWGGAKTHEERAALLVEPVAVDAIDADFAGGPR